MGHTYAGTLAKGHQGAESAPQIRIPETQKASRSDEQNRNLKTRLARNKKKKNTCSCFMENWFLSFSGATFEAMFTLQKAKEQKKKKIKSQNSIFSNKIR
jgi:hypothetical protein